MWSLYVSIAGLILSGGLALVFGFNRSKLAKELGGARAEIASLMAEIMEKERELEGLRIALARALDPAPTLSELERVSALQAGDSARPGADDAIDVP